MKFRIGAIRSFVIAGGAALLLGAGVNPSAAQMAAPAPKINPADVSLDQKLNNQVPLDATFTDESGRSVRIGDYVHGKPVILNLIFYKCAGVCMRELEGMVDLFRNKEMSLNVGEDFEVVTVSINPTETPEMAAAKKNEFLGYMGKPAATKGWHFLVGKQEEIQKVAASVGFRYAYDAKADQYAHPAGIILLTPSGKVSKYFYQAKYPARDVRLALVEASDNKIGSLADKLVLNCIYQYDPSTGRYGVAIVKALRIGGVATVLILLVSIVGMSVRSGKKTLPPTAAAGGPDAALPNSIEP